MKKPQWLTLALSLLLVLGLFAATQASLFGYRNRKAPAAVNAVPEKHTDGLSTDSVLFYAKQNLPPSPTARLAVLEKAVLTTGETDQKLHRLHQLARYWIDSARAFSPLAWYPYAHYTAEAARLENSAKSLSFAAHLFLKALSSEEAHQIKHWEADQAKDLFERSLKLDPQNDSAKVGLGATLLYGGLDAPMKAIGMIREVADRNPTHRFAQLTLGEASLLSGQLEKAVERFQNVLRQEPTHLQAGLLLADTYERLGKKQEAAAAYRQALPAITHPEMRKEVEKRIVDLKTK